ncbi:MAG: acyl carrier protein [Thermoleophilaceae bacterium]|nr:acyl carrier protein [Thermoleophilaceae bacterium]
MTRDEIYAAISRTLSEELEIDASRISPEANFKDDLDADSLHLVELVMELEDSYSIKIPDDEVSELLTVGAVVDYIAAKLGAAA